MTQESGDWESRAWGWEVWDRTHVRTCVDVSVHVLVSQLGSGKGAELGSEGQEGLGVRPVPRGKPGLEGQCECRLTSKCTRLRGLPE